LGDRGTIFIGNLPMNLRYPAATEFAMRFQDPQKVAGFDRDVLADVARAVIAADTVWRKKTS
jgi:hypothetical protein